MPKNGINTPKANREREKEEAPVHCQSDPEFQPVL